MIIVLLIRFGYLKKLINIYSIFGWLEHNIVFCLFPPNLCEENQVSRILFTLFKAFMFIIIIINNKKCISAWLISNARLNHWEILSAGFKSYQRSTRKINKLVSENSERKDSRGQRMWKKIHNLTVLKKN